MNRLLLSRSTRLHCIGIVLLRNNHQKRYTKILQIFSNGDQNVYIQSSKSDSKEFESVETTSKMKTFDTLTNLRKYGSKALSQLLPFGYPSSVNVGYGRFALLQFTAATFSTVCGVFSMQSLFYAVGLGSNLAYPFAAAFNWIVKDGLGQLGGVLFASAVNSKFDADPKRWRLLAAISLDLSCFIELLSPLAPQYFLLIASIANVGKNISYLAHSSSRAAIHKSFAIHENLGDVTAKSGSQTILASLIGTSLGLSAASMIGNHFPSTISFFMICSLCGLTATYLSLRQVIISTFTISRLDIILENYFAYDVVMSPEQIMKKERFLGLPRSSLPAVYVGSDLREVIPNSSDIKTILNLFEDDNYILTALTTTSSLNVFGEVHLLLKVNATKQDIVYGLVHAYIARVLLSEKGYKHASWIRHQTTNYQKKSINFHIIEQSKRIFLGQDVTKSIQLSENEIKSLCSELLNHPQWTIEEMHLETNQARIDVRES